MVENNTALNAGVKALGEGAEKLVVGNQQVVDGVKNYKKILKLPKKLWQQGKSRFIDLNYLMEKHH